MSHRLLINPGTPQAWEIQLKPGVNRIGSNDDNDFVIQHPSVAAHHCELTVLDAGVTLKDLGSANGTFVERIPVRQLQLQSGHHVQLGAVGMIFESVGLPPLPDAVNLPADGAKIMVANPSPGAPLPPPAPPGFYSNKSEGADSNPSGPASKTAIRNFTATTSITSASPQPPDKQALLRGSIGAVVGGLIGMLAWFALIKFIGFTHGLVAWGIGGLIGVCARFLSKNGSMALGSVCAVCALSAIICGEYYGTRALIKQNAENLAAFADLAYEAQKEYAKEALAAKTPDDIRKLIAESEEKTVVEVTAADLEEFQKDLPELEQIASGKISKEDYRQKLIETTAAEFDFIDHYFKQNPKSGIFTLLFIGLGVATAWKIGAGEAAGS